MDNKTSFLFTTISVWSRVRPIFSYREIVLIRCGLASGRVKSMYLICRLGAW